MLILIFQTRQGNTASWTSSSLTLVGAWSLIGVVWGNILGSYFDDYLLQLAIYNHDSYFGTEVSLYSEYPAYWTAFVLKTIVNYFNIIWSGVLFRDWHNYVQYQRLRHLDADAEASNSSGQQQQWQLPGGDSVQSEVAEVSEGEEIVSFIALSRAVLIGL